MAAKSNVRRESLKRHRDKLPERNLAPLSPITCINSTGRVTLPSSTIRTDEVGWKAFGLSSLPPEWVPKFLLVSADCFRDADAERQLEGRLKQGMDQAGVRGAVVMLRSSGTEEIVSSRGELISGTCSPDEIVATIRNWIATLPSGVSSRVHWLV